MEFAKIVLFSLLAAIAYGILHDQVTAHLCVEYFTIAHPPLFPTEAPFWLAIGWGIVATWWVGLPLGLLLAVSARIGAWPKLGVAKIRPLVLMLMLGMAACAAIAGAAGWVLAEQGHVELSRAWMIPDDRQVAFMADAWAHAASYLTGILGGLIVIGLVAAWRFKLARTAASN
jgi:hypothetical protein